MLIDCISRPFLFTSFVPLFPVLHEQPSVPAAFTASHRHYGRAHSSPASSLPRLWAYRSHAAQASCGLDSAMGQLVRSSENGCMACCTRPAIATTYPATRLTEAPGRANTTVRGSAVAASVIRLGVMLRRSVYTDIALQTSRSAPASRNGTSPPAKHPPARARTAAPPRRTQIRIATPTAHRDLLWETAPEAWATDPRATGPADWE